MKLSIKRVKARPPLTELSTKAVPVQVEASVIIPAFNAAQHIEEQLLALARQRTDVSWELVVADNGSSDETLAIVHRLASNYPVPIRIVNASNRNGATGARNAGVAAASGGLLLFTDADDVVDEQWVEEMVRALRVHQLVGGRIETVELNGEEIASWRANAHEHSLPTFEGRPWVSGCNFGCTASAYAAIDEFDESVALSEDIDLSLRMYAQGVTAVFAEQAIVQRRYRHQPWLAIRQMWSYGASGASLYERHEIDPPTFLDGLIVLFRATKHALRDVLQGRLPVRPAVDLAFVLGEGSVVWRDPDFWRPAPRRYLVANPLIVSRSRVERLVPLVVSRVGRRLCRRS